MRILIVKTSSLGDVVHTFPALTDAQTHVPHIQFDWLVEQAFADLPKLHPAVRKVKTIGLRKWRKGWCEAWHKGQLQTFYRELREDEYDLIIDAQGLIVKSAIPAKLARGKVVGFDKDSAKEGVSSWFYQEKVSVDKGLHAIERTRRLFAHALGYAFDSSPVDYGLRVLTQPQAASRNYIVCLHGTTWPSKHWPLEYWATLARLAKDSGYTAKFPWGSPEERLRAEAIIKAAGQGELLPKLNLSALPGVLANAAGVVGVDSGLAHLSAALAVPAVTIYGSTKVGLTGAVGQRQENMAAQFPCAPCMKRECAFQGESEFKPACYESVNPYLVWDALHKKLGR